MSVKGDYALMLDGLVGLLLLAFIGVLIVSLASTSDKQKSSPPNMTSTSSQPHSAEAWEALRKADWRCQHCLSITSPGIGDPLHIEELPSAEYVGAGAYSKFRILCKSCTENGRVIPLGLFPVDPNAPTTSSLRKSLPQSVREQVYRRDNYTCRKCGAKGGPQGTLGVQLHIDHIVPVAKGGTDEINNLQVLCAPCNAKKGSKPWSVARFLDAIRDRD